MARFTSFLMSRRPTARQLAPLLRQYGGGLAVRGVEVIGKLGLYMLAARALGAQDAGYFFLCLTWMGLLSTIARLGLDRAITRHTAAELAIGKGLQARRALITGFAWTTLGGTLAGLFTWLVAAPVSHYVFREPALAPHLALSALLLLPQTLTVCVGAALAGLKRSVVSQLLQNALWPALTLAAILGGVDRLDWLLWALTLSMVLSSAIGLVLILGERHRLVDNPDPEHLAAEAMPSLWRTALPLSVVEIIQVSLISLPLLALGVFASAAEVGAFSIAARISQLVWVIIVSIGTVAAPLFAELHRRKEFDRLRSTNRLVRAVVMLCSLPVLVIMFALPEEVLSLIGESFTMATTALLILAAGQLVNGLLPCQDVLLAMTGHGRILRTLNLLQLASCVVFGALLIPAFGMLGAAVLSSLCIAQGAIGTTLAVRRIMPRAF